LLSTRVIGDQDVSPALSTCSRDSCPQDCLQMPDSAELCLLKAQEPLLFRDALAAVGYIIDIHAFYSLTEYYYDGINDLLAAIREKEGGIEPPLLVPIWTLKYSRPAEVPLSALLARDGGNVFPASNNIGISQIANGLYRTHANELAIGQAVGSLLAAAIQQNVSPFSFQNSRLRIFQHSLVEQGFVLYPVEDMMDDVLLRTGVQHLILEGLLTPAAVLPEDGPSVWGTLAYRTSPKSAVNERDLPVVQALFPAAVPEPLTYRHLLSLVSNIPAQGTDERLKQSGLQLGVIDASHRSLATDKLLTSTPSKGDLYRIASLLLRERWATEQK
ncbi:MAG: FAD-dependent oxidoreductase, partial [Candidatus Peribacteraceae bacterium]|nr:FAD-dependent oxidoreductase [Candidatus Peribacteraceae bacterium]